MDRLKKKAAPSSAVTQGKETDLNNRPQNGLYYFFYVLFSVDTWRILIGFTLAVIFGPRLTAGRGLGTAGEIVVWVMVLAIGYAASQYPARFISKGLRKFFTVKA
jgi:hypothetical protein